MSSGPENVEEPILPTPKGCWGHDAYPTTPENVECQECNGFSRNGDGWRCPACKGMSRRPENVETSRRESALGVTRRLGHELPTETEQRARIDREFPTPTPENVDTPPKIAVSHPDERWPATAGESIPMHDCTPENVESPMGDPIVDKIVAKLYGTPENVETSTICGWCDDCLMEYGDNPFGYCPVTGGYDPDAPSKPPRTENVETPNEVS